MYKLQEDLAEALRQFSQEQDQSQDACYEEFLSILGLDHTEKLWDAFVLAWTTGEGWGQAAEYSYPS
jgi:hypothetical protein